MITLFIVDHNEKENVMKHNINAKAVRSAAILHPKKDHDLLCNHLEH